MTTPDRAPDDDDSTQGSGDLGSLSAASEHDDAAGDPLGPLNRVSEELAPNDD